MHNRKNSDCWRFALQLVLSMVVGTITQVITACGSTSASKKNCDRAIDGIYGAE